MRHLLIIAGGTGGHIFPGLAVASTMRKLGWKVTWLGTSHGMEGELVKKHGINLHKINFSGVRGKGILRALQGMCRMLISLPACFILLRRLSVDAVLGMGGYVTVPGGFAAGLLRIPLVIVNADTTWLLSNLVLSPFSKKVLFGLPTKSRVPTAKYLITGNPISKEISRLPPSGERYSHRTGSLNLLVLGGSLGSEALNDCLPDALALIRPDLRPNIVHQSGKKHVQSLRYSYKRAGVKAEVLSFIDDMPRRYADADLVVCRAGAMTLSELAAAGVASILIPLTVSTTSHQIENARWMESHGGAIHLPQKNLNKENLATLISNLSRQDCYTMGQAAYSNSYPYADQSIAEILSEITNSL